MCLGTKLYYFYIILYNVVSYNIEMKGENFEKNNLQCSIFY